MGSFLTILQKQKRTRSQLQFFHNHSLTKVQQYYEQYKSISDTLAIDDSEFSQIFGHQNLSVFQILDTDKNLLIDGLELFAGLVLYSKMINFEDKILFLFNLFDFNEQNSLFPNDIEFMFLSCCTFTHKIYGLRSQLNQVWIEQYVRGEFFNGEVKINVSQLLKWAKSAAYITMFFEEILQRPVTDNSSILSNKIYIKTFTELHQIQPHPSSYEINQPIYEKHISQIKSKLQTFHQEKVQYTNSDVCFDIGWVYGIRINDVKKIMRVIEGKNNFLEIAYLVGKLAVIYDCQAKTQRHYREHHYPLISMQVNHTKKIIATGEERDNPDIRIWSYQTLKTLYIIPTSHKNGVHSINFSKDGNFITHAGCHSEGSFNIHNLISGETIFSLFCQTPIVDITELENFTSCFIIQSLVTGLYQVNLLTVTVQGYMQAIEHPQKRRAQFLIKQHPIQACQFTNDGKPLSKITCSAFYMLNRNLPYLDHYDDSFNKYIITGHQKGEVNVWNPQFKTFEFQLCHQKTQIIKIIITRQYVIIVTDSSYISFWDIAIEKKQKRKVVDITQLSYHLHSYNVRDLVPLQNDDEYLICTSKGDMFILGPQIKASQIIKFSMIQKNYQVEVIEEIFPIEGNIVTTKLLTKSTQAKTYQELFCGGDLGVIFTINAKTHQRVAAWNIGQKIVHFDVGESKHHGTIVVAATSSNKVYTKIGFLQSTQKIEIKDSILFVLLSPDTTTLIISTNYYEQNNLLIFMVTTKLSYTLNSTIPMPEKVVYMQLIEKKSLLCITENNQVLLVSLKDLHFKPFAEIQRSFPNPVLNVVYWLKQLGGKCMPIIVGAQCKAIMMARHDGTILTWRNQDELELGSRVDLYGHSSHCSSLVLNQEQTCLYSSGFSDHTLIEWSLKFFIQKNSATTAHLLKLQQIQEDQDQFLEREVAFCIFKNNLLTEMYDQHLLVRGIGSNNDTLSKLFKSMLQQWKLVNQTSASMKDEPSLGLKLDFVLGMEVFNKNETVLSLAGRKIAYFISRVIVLYDPSLNKQQLYTCHRYKVTCIHKLQHNDQQLIASGQSSYRPNIHLWSTQTLQTLKIIETGHRWGIINITIQGDNLLSYGFKQGNNPDQETITNKTLNYQFQTINIWSENKIATLVSKHAAYCIRLHPVRDEIVISTYGCVIFYENAFGHYRKKSICYVDDQHVTCMQFYQIRTKNKVQYDLLVGTRKGTIAMICQERNFVVIKSRAHEQRINCLLKIMIRKEMYFVTTSEDQMIKIWSRKFALMYFSQMKKNQSDDILKGNFDRKATDFSYLRNRAVQSLTVFSVQQDKNPTLLLGTRNGDIFELIIQTDFMEKDPFRNSKYLLYSKNNITQSHLPETKKVLFAHHPKLQIIVTIGQDQNLLFWDTDASGGGNRFIFSKYLGYTSIPTAMKFTKDGDYLIIGFSDGLLIFLDSKISKSLQGKTDDKFIMPLLSLIKKEKAEQNNAILNIELSDSGQHLAVSYNYRILQTKQKKQASSNSFISLFNNKTRDKIKNFSKMDPNKGFQKFTSITCPYSENFYKTQKNNQYGMAAYSMTFAEGEGKFYLLIYYQLVDSFQNRLNYSTEGKYNVWDVSTSTMIANLDLVGSLNWKKLCFQNSIYSKYMFWKNLIEYKRRSYEQDQPVNNNLYIPHMTALINIPYHLILGSVNGDLHIVKASALQFQGTNPQQKDMFIAKTYPGHCSQINQIQINPEKVYIYSTSIHDECIFKYRLQGSTKLNMEEQTFMENVNSQDLFNEVPEKESFEKMLRIYEAKEKLESRRWIDTENFLQKISIVDIIGRKASTMRHNLFIEGGRRIIYNVGQAIVNWNQQTQQKKFICCSNSSQTLLNEITQIQVSNDNRSMVAAHSGLDRSTVVMWQVNCKNILKEFFVNGMSNVVLMALNHDNSRMVLYGVDKNLKASLILVDFCNYRPLAVVSYAHKPVWVIKAIHFAQESQSVFYTCGVQETKRWTFSGNQITYQEISYDLMSNKKIIHLSMLVINKTLVTGGDDGFVYVWRNQIVKKQGHESMVTCMAKDRPYSKNAFLSGGKDGNIVLWQLQQNTLILVKKFNLLSLSCALTQKPPIILQSQQKQPNFSQQVQSINLYHSQIVFGTRNGNIYHTTLQLLNTVHEQRPIKELFTFHDFEFTQAMFFANEEELFEISKEGLFTVWRFKEYRMIYESNFKEEVVNMIYHSKSKCIFIAFRKQLRVFIVEREQPTTVNIAHQSSSSNLMPKSANYKLRELPELSISLKHITHIAFSNNQKMLALGIESNSDQSIYIEIYEIPEDLKTMKSQLKKLFKISLTDRIEFVDFSLNNKFLLIALKEMVIIRDLAESKNLNHELISKIQWCNKGVLYGKEAQPSILKWQEQWGGLSRQQKSKTMASTNSKGLKRNTSQGSQNSLNILRVEPERFVLIQKCSSIFVYQLDNMIGKFTLPITTIDHFCISASKNYVALACEIDRMIVVLDISKCIGKSAKE